MTHSNPYMEGRGSLIALGYFDGVHRGHQAVLQRAVQKSGVDGCTPMALTFDMSLMRPGSKAPGDIMTGRQRYSEMARLGIPQTVAMDFRNVAGLSGEEFVRDILVGSYRACGVCCGGDFRFGTGRSCGIDELEELCKRYGLTLDVVAPVLHDGLPISSTRIRGALEQGDMEAVNGMLGRSYSQRLVVYRDRQLATRLGFPTINQRFPGQLACPRFGVYHTRIQIDSTWYDAVSNIGRRPTVEGGDVHTVLESHILDFTGNLYRRKIEVRFLSFLRDEQRFDSLDELKTAVLQDIRSVRKRMD